MAIRQIVSALAGALALVSAGTFDNARAQNWDGSGLIKFGVFLQGSMIDYDIAQRTLTGDLIARQAASPDGFGVGISAGYDLRLGSFVFGVEADASFDDGGAKVRPQLGFTREQWGIDHLVTLRARFGYVVHPDLMVYGTVGYSLLGTEYKDNNSTLASGGVTAAIAKRYATVDGIVFGGGAEYDLGWGIGFVEYLHNEIGSWDFKSFTTGTLANNRRISLDGGSQDIVRIGLKFKVGHDHTHDVYRVPDRLK